MYSEESMPESCSLVKSIMDPIISFECMQKVLFAKLSCDLVLSCPATRSSGMSLLLVRA